MSVETASHATTPCPGSTLGGLEHYTVNGGMVDIDELRDFYRDMLGMLEGPRPDFNFPGYWMYAAGRPVVHIVGWRDRARLEKTATGPMDHIAIRATGFQTLLDHLRANQIEARVNHVPGGQLAQIFIRDPMGVQIELLFSGEGIAG